ncbi:MAG: Protein-export membrane protein SecG [Alphaproteobacteria bacterium MarineAlpha9_Bin3]|nr:MAG: Protein-export membrane protein SecG [Alphaproteobacteria bacterium MarineAlpha9_Bin3]|tara:strand:+ start:34202 stop:34543 length:342 start_codon:yes stop_codon:yes gene_type:complete
MAEIVLAIHVLLALGLIVFILLQRSDGGALGGLGGGMSLSGIMGNQGSANFLTRITAIFAALFMITSLILAIMESRNDNESSSILDGSVESEMNSPLIKIDEDIDNPAPPKAE